MRERTIARLKRAPEDDAREIRGSLDKQMGTSPMMLEEVSCNFRFGRCVHRNVAQGNRVWARLLRFS